MRWQAGVIDAPLAFALALGMVATVNPCGFAMLPAYLSFFVGVDETPRGGADSTAAGVARALVVSLAVTAGFAATFVLIGLVVSHVTRQVYDLSPWLSVVIGAALVALGVALLSGWELAVRLPHLDRGGRSRGLGSMFVFGVSYAVASLGCTLPLFLGQVGGTLTEANVVSGVATFAAYAAGMGLVLTVLTIAIALARRSLVARLRSLLPYVNRIAGALLVVAGAYVMWFAVVEIRLGSGGTGDAITDRVWDWSFDVQRWVQDVGPTRLASVLAAVVAVALLYVTVIARSRRRSARG